MHDDPRRKFENAASRVATAPVPDGVAFGVMAGSMMLGAVMARAEQPHAPISLRPNTDAAVPPNADPPKSEALPHDPLPATVDADKHPGSAIVDPGTSSQQFHEQPLRHDGALDIDDAGASHTSLGQSTG